ncbi:ParB-like chromosome segregation protein Spo0J [Catenulispora sp. MAP5-51]|uniref:ParB/RepB/Spo0J family partition protein n=1 Tax=Catenulispora sp. MAP5-51 TaxID=3156298 RepID=UPI003514E483
MRSLDVPAPRPAEHADGEVARSAGAVFGGTAPTTSTTFTASPASSGLGDVVHIPVAALLPGESPRLDGQNDAHVARLAEIDGPLPPILVDRRSMRVIDGTHRLMAAALRGWETIAVRFYDGDTEDAFLHAVEANVRHGFPLSQADRRAAAARIITTHPHLSDRAIAQVAGLGAKTVAAVRRQSGDGSAQVEARVGRDGRVRPLNAEEGRLKAAEVLTENPDMPLREVARVAGVSPATAGDVRKRLERGDLPAPQRATRNTGGPRVPPVAPAAVLGKLMRDPSLRHKQEGRRLLRLVHDCALSGGDWNDMLTSVPAHCTALVRQLALQYAQDWTRFAQELDDRVKAEAGA